MLLVRKAVLQSKLCQSGFIKVQNDHQVSWSFNKYVCVKMTNGSLMRNRPRSCVLSGALTANRVCVFYIIFYWCNLLIHVLRELVWKRKKKKKKEEEKGYKVKEKSPEGTHSKLKEALPRKPFASEEEASVYRVFMPIQPWWLYQYKSEGSPMECRKKYLKARVILQYRRWSNKRL